MKLTDRHEVIERLCRLSSEVAEHFQWKHAADCFCGRIQPDFRLDFRYSEKALSFIEAAVRDRIAAADRVERLLLAAMAWHATADEDPGWLDRFRVAEAAFLAAVKDTRKEMP